MALIRTDITGLLQSLNSELVKRNVAGQLHLVGGAVMCIVHEARQSTQDVDGYFKPANTIRDAARIVATNNDLPDDWLNDAVKRYLSPNGDFHPWGSFSHLQVLTATPEYLLAMKCLAMQLCPEFHDEADVRFLLRYLNMETTASALKVIERYYPLERFPPKTMFALQQILGR